MTSAASGGWAGQHLVVVNWRDGGHPLAGGAEVYCESVAREAAALGLDVTLLTAGYCGARAADSAPWGRVVRRGGRFTVYPRALAWLWRHRRSVDAVLDSQNGIPFFTPLAVGRRVPVALIIHHVHQEQFGLYFPRPLAALGRFLERDVSRFVYGGRAVCAVSPSSRAEIRRQLAFRGPVYVTPCGQDLPPDQPTGSAFRSATPRIVCVGRLVPHKRFDLLIEAVAAVPGLELHLVGTGESRGSLAALVDRLDVADRVVLHGKLPAPQRDRLLASAWVTASMSAGEGWGLAVLEAAALGVPAVAFAVPGLRDSIQDRTTGWLLDPPAAEGTPEAVRAATVTAMTDGLRDGVLEVSDPARADELARSCRAWAASLSWTATTERILSVLASERAAGASTGRRHTSDAATVVEFERVPVEAAVRASGAAIAQRLRLTDQVAAAGDTVRVLLGGTDEQEARSVVARMGLLHTVRAVRLARHRDLLGWPGHHASAGQAGEQVAGAGPIPAAVGVGAGGTRVR